FYFILNNTTDKVDLFILNSTFLPFFCYTLMQIFIGIILALIAKKFILKYYLDIKFKFLPITTEWDQLLSGRLYEYDRILKINLTIQGLKEFKVGVLSKIDNLDIAKKEKRTKKKEINLKIRGEIKKLKKARVVPDYSFVEIDALVSTACGDMIYKGRIFKYYLGKDNTLDKIIMKDAFRRKFIDVKDEANKNLPFYEFASKLFVIKYSEVKNLNVRFSFLEKKAEM
ncbi:hypothetical protein MEO40_27475, partial [Dolichospermum sp. ST_sed1]|nr:hypothetical protein [Dolichospermum sp. ST_sed1]